MIQILVLEPFGARAAGQGSHAAFIHGWQAHSSHAFHVLELPGIHWKWRSRHAAWTFAQLSENLVNQGQHFDIVFCSEMLNVAEWRGLASPQLAELPVLTYFHENQFTYPLPSNQTPDYHLAYSHILTVMSSNALWFNSAFHLEDFRSAAEQWLRRMPDYQHRSMFMRKMDEASVAYPGIELSSKQVVPTPPVAPTVKDPRAAKPLTIGWVSRWEHDKRPDRLVELVRGMLDKELPFELILLGQQFSQESPSLRDIKLLAASHIRHVGYAESRQQYLELLAEMDVVVSMADHENFGIAILEAIAQGAVPLLPNRLAYPEVLSACSSASSEPYLYTDIAQALERLERWIGNPAQLAHLAGQLNPALFEWRCLASDYDARISKLQKA